MGRPKAGEKPGPVAADGDSAQLNWDRYSVVLNFRENLLGGVPKNQNLIETWLAQKMITEEENINEVIRATGGDLPAKKEEASWNTFMRSPAGVLCLRDYQVKAMLKESANILGLTKAIRGFKNALTNGMFVRPTYIPILEQSTLEPFRSSSGQIEIAGHIIGPQGPRSILSRYDHLERARLEFQIKVVRTYIEGRPVLTEEHLIALFEHAQESGLGAARSRSSGTFDVEELLWENRPKK